MRGAPAGYAPKSVAPHHRIKVLLYLVFQLTAGIG